jgi:hypothetical protein
MHPVRDVEAERRMDEAQDAFYPVEHGGAWVMAIIAAGLAVFGTLVGLDVLTLRDTSATIVSDADEGGQTLLSTRFWDGAMLLFSAIVAGLLALCLHANDHHRLRDLSTVKSSERNLWAIEHGLAYIVALASVIFVVFGLLVGFNAISDTHDQGDGLIWIWFGVAAATVTTALHTVRHHQAAVEQDYIIAIVEEHVRVRGTTSTPTQPGGQRR